MTLMLLLAPSPSQSPDGQVPYHNPIPGIPVWLQLVAIVALLYLGVKMVHWGLRRGGGSSRWE